MFYNKQKQMIGSLGEFIPIQSDSILAQDYRSDRLNHQLSPLHPIKRRGKSTFDKYVPQDKTDLLLRYEKNNIYHINRKKYTSIQKQAISKQKIKRPLYQHHSFFVKPEIAKDHISKQELKRKHNLLRAIMRMKQNQEEPKRESDYQQSFQRLYSGFRSIHPEPVLKRKEEVLEQEQIVVNSKVTPVMHARSKSNLPNRKRLQFENCLSWAKKHKKNGDYFAQQLGKVQKNYSTQSPISNRSIIDEIVKKVDLN